MRNLKESKLRLGLSWTKAIGKSSAGSDLIFSPATDGPPPPGTLPPNSRIIDNPPGTPLPPDIVNALSRIFVSVYSTRRFRNSVVLVDGGPSLNLLDGFALNSLGGSPRYELSLSGGIFKRGVGVRTNISWRSASVLDAEATGSGPSQTSLRFTYRPIVDFQIFLNPEDRIIGHVPSWTRGLQLTFSVRNALNLRPSVRDQSGDTPLRFQSAYLDPLGRSFELSLRKVFR